MRSRWLAQGMSYHNLNLQNLLKRVTEAPAVGSNEQQYKWLVEGTDGTQRTVEKCVVIKFYLKAAGDEPAWSCAHCTAKGWSADRALCCIECGMPTPMDEARFDGLRQDKRAQMAKRPTDRPPPLMGAPSAAPTDRLSPRPTGVDTPHTSLDQPAETSGAGAPEQNRFQRVPGFTPKCCKFGHASLWLEASMSCRWWCGSLRASGEGGNLRKFELYYRTRRKARCPIGTGRHISPGR